MVPRLMVLEVAKESAQEMVAAVGYQHFLAMGL